MLLHVSVIMSHHLFAAHNNIFASTIILIRIYIYCISDKMFCLKCVVVRCQDRHRVPYNWCAWRTPLSN